MTHLRVYRFTGFGWPSTGGGQGLRAWGLRAEFYDLGPGTHRVQHVSA